MTRASWPWATQTSTHSAQPLQWAGSMKRPKSRRLDAALGGDVGVLGRVDEVGLGRLGGQRRVRLAGRESVDRVASEPFGWAVAIDGAVGAGADAGHAADTLVGDELRDQRRKRAEVADAGGRGGDEAAAHAHVGRKLDVGHAATVGIDDVAC